MKNELSEVVKLDEYPRVRRPGARGRDLLRFITRDDVLKRIYDEWRKAEMIEMESGRIWPDIREDLQNVATDLLVDKFI